MDRGGKAQLDVPLSELAELARVSLGPAGTGVIWAQGSGSAPGWECAPGGGAIGRGGTMPWHVPADLAWFKQVTLGAPVIMGRRTWESLPARFRPLPGRRNIVVSRAAEAEFPGAEHALDLSQAAQMCVDQCAWVIGGGQLYAAALAHATVAVISQFELEVPDADTWAPLLDPHDWELRAVSEKADHSEFAVRSSLWVRKTPVG